MANTYGRQVVVPLTNKSGGGVIAGDVVIVGTANNDAFTTTTSAAFTGTVGIAQATIADNATGPVLLSGYAALVNTTASVTRQNFGTTSTTVKKAVDAGSSRIAGTFCQFLTGGTTPDAVVWPTDLGAGTGAVSLLAVSAYNPAEASYTTTSTSFADVDATNVKVTFTAPASGNIVVKVSVPGLNQSGGNGIVMDLRESTTNIGSCLMHTASTSLIIRGNAVFYVTGVTAGSHTYKLGWAQDAAGGTTTLYYGSTGTVTRGPIIMEVWSAP